MTHGPAAVLEQLNTSVQKVQIEGPVESYRYEGTCLVYPGDTYEGKETVCCCVIWGSNAFIDISSNGQRLYISLT